MSARPETSESWRERAPRQRDRILGDLRDPSIPAGWVCSYFWVQAGIFRAGARIWELRHQDFHRIEERICSEHKVAEYRLVWDAERDRA